MDHRQFFSMGWFNATPLFDTTTTKAGNLLMKCKNDPWIDFHEELFHYEISRWVPGQPLQWGYEKQLPKNYKVLFPFLIDRSGILWTGTKGYGLRKYNIASKKFRSAAQGYSVRYIVPSGMVYSWEHILTMEKIRKRFGRTKCV